MFIDEFLAGMSATLSKDASAPVSVADISYISVTAEELARLPGPVGYCSFVGVNYVKHHGVTFRQSLFALPAVQGPAQWRGRVAWKLTKATRHFFAGALS
jgi:hypothetical protein